MKLMITKQSRAYGPCRTPEEKREYQREYTKRNRVQLNAARADYFKKVRVEVVEKYGGKCVCCGETQFEFLCFDHINNDGSEHRKAVKHSMALWLKKSGFPSNFQILCFNCNNAKQYSGGCPHRRDSL